MAMLGKAVYYFTTITIFTVSSHHITWKKAEVGLKGLCIREITLKYDYITHRMAISQYTTVPDDMEICFVIIYCT